jgi:two-component system chemotaxis response regulator CheB
MPVLDGVETIKGIREFDKDIPIIIFSGQNINAANKTLEALHLGADDFVSKITTSIDINENFKMIQEELIPRFKALTARKQRFFENRSQNKDVPVEVKRKINLDVNINIDLFRPDIICIASSTGGPDMLMTVFNGLELMKVPVVIVQHMPPIFTTQLAASLNKLSENTVVEAKHGEELLPGHVYLAPGDYHMEVKKNINGKYVTALNQEEKVCFVRPAADVLFKSVAENFNGKIASFVFTGMGCDGADGTGYIKNKDGIVMIQDEDSCVVWGMPRAVYEKKTYDGIFSPEKIIEKLNILGRK